MRLIASTVMALLLVVGAGRLAAEEVCCAKLKATQEKISSLLKDWQGASSTLASLSAEKRVALKKGLGELAASCPIGQRVSPTIKLAHDLLKASVAADAACAEKCAGKAKLPAELVAGMKARRELLVSLNELAKHCL